MTAEPFLFPLYLLTNHEKAYLTFAGVKFSLRSSNNHASPSGSLPFLLLPPTTAGDSRPPIPSNRLQKWVKDQGKLLHEPESVRYEAYLSLLDHRIRHAWVCASFLGKFVFITDSTKLYTLYLDDRNFNTVARQLYIVPCSSNSLVRTAIAYQLQNAATEELLKHSKVIDGDEILLEAKLAFEALSNLLGQDEYFFGAAKPGLFDASVFAYSHLLLDKSLGWKNEQLAHHLEKSKNLVNHRERILQDFFGRD